MNKTKKIALIIIGIAILALIFTVIYSRNKNKKEELQDEAMEKYIVPPKESIFINGNIASREQQIISADLTKGKVEKIHVEDGAKVKKDEPLVTFKKEEITEQISELNNEIADLKEMKKDEEATIEEQQLTIDESELESPEAIEQPALNVGGDYDIQIKRLERQIEELKKKEYLVEHSKLDGKVNIEKTQMEDGSEGTIIFVRSHDFVAQGVVNEVDLLKLKKDMKVTLTLIADDSKREGKIDEITMMPSSESGGEMVESFGEGGSSFSEYPVIFSIDDQKGLVEGFHVQVKIPYGEDKILIPEEAIIKEDNKTYIFLIKDNILKKHEIETGVKEEEYIVVTKGLKENDEIIAKVIEDMEEGDIFE